MKRPTYVLTAILAILASLVVQGRAQDTSCLNQLSPCMNYLNGSRDPPSTCCDPLKDVISSNPECICSLISNQGAGQAKQMGINLTEVQQLPAKCGQAINPVGCLKSAPSPQSSAGSFLCSTSCIMLVLTLPLVICLVL